jgi:ABC-2 type transport system permease protein
MYTLRTLTKSSLKMFLRNKQALYFTLFFPLILMAVFGFIGFDRPPSFDVGLVTHQPSPETQQFVDQLKKFPTFKVHEGSKDEELAQLNQGNRAAVLEVPDNFISGTQAGKPTTITVYANEGQAAQSQTVISILNQYLNQATLMYAHVHPYFTIDQQSVNAHNLRYIDFLVPGLIALSIMQMSIFSVAFLFAQLKERGVLKRLMATPMRPSQFVAANAITRLIVGVAQGIIFIAAAILLFHIHVIGAYWLILLIMALGSLMFLGLGFTVSGVSKTVESVPAIANLVAFPMLFLGNVFFQISSMPGWLQYIAKYLPLTFFASALRDVMTKGSNVTGIWTDLLAMVIWSVVLIAVATWTFSFQEKESAT